MRFTLDSSHLDFKASVDSMLGAADVPSISRAKTAGDIEPTRALWKSMANLGITGLLVDPEFDGLGATPLDMVVAMESLGRWAVPGPVVESIVAVPTLLGALDPSPLHTEWLADLAAGSIVATIALEPAVPCALDPDIADLILLVRDRTMTTATTVQMEKSVDPSRSLGSVVGDAEVGAEPVTERALEDVETLAALGCAAQLLGAGQSLLEATVEYAKVRRQFGRSIGSFQAIKHSLADVMIGLEMARPLLYNAALSVGADSSTARRDVSAAKIYCGSAAYRSSRTALQVHGAIGYTLEFDLSLWITKVRALQSSWGTAASHRRRVLESL